MKFLNHYMKIWGDPYGKIRGEVKGGTMGLNYEILIVTANYSIKDVCQDDQLMAAIQRRFKEIEMK